MLKPADAISSTLVDRSTMTVAGDAYCVQCEYNLRTLAVGGQCPECGLPVVKSLRTSDLCAAASDWLAEVRHGFARTTFGAAVFLFSVVLLFLALTIRTYDGLFLATVASVGGVIALAVAMSGVSRVVAPDCMPPVSGEPVFARKVARCAMEVLYVAAVPIVIGLCAFEEFGPLAPGFVAALASVTGAAFGVYVRWYAHRGRRPRLEKMTTVAVWLIGACGVTVLYWSIFWFLSSPVPGRATSVSAALLSLGGLADLGTGGALVLFAVTSGWWTMVTFVYWRMFGNVFAVSRKRETTELNSIRQTERE